METGGGGWEGAIKSGAKRGRGWNNRIIWTGGMMRSIEATTMREILPLCSKMAIKLGREEEIIDAILETNKDTRMTIGRNDRY